MDTGLVATILVENGPAERLRFEHGLSVHLACGSTSVLLDFGQSDAFARNAADLGIDLAGVDHAVLSHAHYDHANGMPAFFALNDHAPLHLSVDCAEDCWSTKGGTAKAHYIGVAPGLLQRYATRLHRVPLGRPSTIAPGVHLVPHTSEGLDRVGRRAGMYRRREDAWTPDDFAHEMTLVVELGPAGAGTPRLVVLNSCSHAGLAAIVAEVRGAFPGARIESFVGGLHLVHASDEEVLEAAAVVREAGVGQVYTGHCTGEHAFSLLSHELPGQVFALEPGLRLEF